MRKYNKNLDKHVQEMKSFGEYLIPYNFPKVTAEEEVDINFIKTREAFIDGYNVILHYNKAEYNNHFLVTLQVLGKYVPFLPFFLVCKIGKRFLGENHLSLVEIFRENRKIYCWTVVLSNDGKPISGPYQEEVEHQVFEGFEYRRMNPEHVNFY